MTTATWTATRSRKRGAVAPIGTPTYPGLTRLDSLSRQYRQFDADAAPGGNISLLLRGGDYFGIYVEVSTNRGRRQFKFIPTDARPRRRHGYRYLAGLGATVRDGQLNPRVLTLGAIVRAVEPGVVITEVRSVFVRVRGQLDISMDRAPVAGIEPAPTPTTSVPTPDTPPTSPSATSTTTSITTTSIATTSTSTGSPVPVDPDGPIRTAAAVRFLNQATFGASHAAITELQSIGTYQAWIEAQMRAPISLTQPWTEANSNGSNSAYRHYVWWENALTGPDQLRQRIAFALSQIFVISDLDYLLSNGQYGVTQYYDMLARNAFGNFRDLLEEVTLHPVMGIYLSMVRNQRADPVRNIRPDENFAREVLQLFSIGLYELSSDGTVQTRSGVPIPSFDQETVENFARVFTGWNFADTGSWDSNRARDLRLPMTPFEDYHDTSAKTLLRGTTLPAGQGAREDLGAALDNIFDHPNVGPFIARQLIQKLVTSNPSSGYVGRVAAAFNNNGSGVRGDLGAVVNAILIDPEARSGHRTDPTTFGKVKEPIMRLTQLWRAFDAFPGPTAEGRYRTRFRTLDAISSVFGQAVLESPSVFNFFRPDHPLEPGGALVAPESQILSEVNLATTNNMLFAQVYGLNNRVEGQGNQTFITIDREMQLASNPVELVDHLNDLLMAGSLSSDFRTALVQHLNTHPSDDEGLLYRVMDGIFCIVASPFHHVQQ